MNRKQRTQTYVGLGLGVLFALAGLVGMLILSGGGVVRTFWAVYCAIIVAAGGGIGGMTVLLLFVDRQYVREGLAKIEDAANAPQEPVDADADEDGDY